ncbi:MAG: NADPH-dependent FMN reductase [Phycicoccus sp.]
MATWVRDRARDGRHREAAKFEVVDLADHALHHLNEKVPAVFGDYAHAHTHRWSATVAALDAFVIVVPEYNHSFPGSLKTALDFLYAEWHDKAVGFVSYGVEGGTRAVEQLRPVAAELRLADVPSAVHLWLGQDSDERGVVESEQLTDRVDAMLDDVVAWGRLLRDHRGSRAGQTTGMGP